MEQREKADFIRILSLDGSDVYRAMHRLDGNVGISVKDRRGRVNTALFKGVLDASLDTDRMKKIYSKSGKMPDRFNVAGGHTLSVVNVSFKYALKEYYNKGKYLYVKDGYDVSYDDLTDHVCVKDIDGTPTLIAIEVQKDSVAKKKKKGKIEHKQKYLPVENPISDDLIGKYFEFDAANRSYRVKHKKKNSTANRADETLIPNKKSKAELREWLYTNGFVIDGIRYVRYKRSAGSSRIGQCLFIAEPMYADMMEWSSCGLDGEAVSDQASWQAYISLTLSSIERKIHIPMRSILLIRDQKSVFTDTVIRVKNTDSGLSAQREEVTIENKIWDGEALLDKSVFDANGYTGKGMMLLRNRFFKTCAFNTNLAEWFSDNGITRIDQLNGYHAQGATVKDIKLVITESSLKYLKFKPQGVTVEEWFTRWLDNVYTSKEESMFGVIKTDKEDAGELKGRLVKTNYQLINTLGLTREDTATFLKDSFDFLLGMQNDPMMLRYNARIYVADADELDLGADIKNYRQKIVTDVMRCTDDFVHTPFYKNYRSEQCKNFKERLKLGRVLVNGSYHTIFGNGVELLRCVIDKKYTVGEPMALSDGEIYTSRFADGEEVLCERSPHITMGNLLVAKNKRVPIIDKYFNLGDAGNIVCVNAIRSNIQQRLNGCDYDSDFMLITNDPILLKNARANYTRFPVPFCDVPGGSKRDYSTSPYDLADLDVQISENRIGEIVNLSQFLNSIYWDRINAGESYESLEGLYCDICKLAVLSGLEIDKAKRPYPVSAGEVLADLRSYKDQYREENGGIPDFFEYMTKKDVSGAGKDATLNTAMSFVYDAVCNDTSRARKTKNISYTALFDLQFKPGDPNYAFAKRRDTIIEAVKKAQMHVRNLNYKSASMTRAELEYAEMIEDMIFEECKERIRRSADDHVLYLLLKELDKDDDSEKDISSCKALLFASMLYAGDGYLMKKLHASTAEMADLVYLDEAPLPDDEVRMIYGYPHAVRTHRDKN